MKLLFTQSVFSLFIIKHKLHLYRYRQIFQSDLSVRLASQICQSDLRKLKICKI